MLFYNNVAQLRQFRGASRCSGSGPCRQAHCLGLFFGIFASPLPAGGGNDRASRDDLRAASFPFELIRILASSEACGLLQFRTHVPMVHWRTDSYQSVA